MQGPQAYLVAITGSFAALVQMVTPDGASAATLDHIERLGINGLLAIAVIVLWKKIQEKDLVLMSNYKSMAEALAANKVVVEKMSDTLDGIKETVEHMDTVRAMIPPARLST